MSNKALVSRLKRNRKTLEALIESRTKRIEKIQSDAAKEINLAEDVISTCESKISELDSQIQYAENDND